MQHQKLYLTTGEFAKLCHTTKHTLFHYCDIGLFLPIYTDENGYRYYHVLQYDTFMTISELKAIGMSLSDIRDYLAERSPQRITELYEMQEQLINKKILQLKKIKSRIRCQKSKIKQVMDCSQPYFKEKREQHIISCSDWMMQRDDYFMTTTVDSLIVSNGHDDLTSSSGMLCKVNESIQSENYPFCFYVNAATTQKGMEHIMQAGTYLCTFHHGSYETLCNTYQKIVHYTIEQKIELDDWFYVETIIGDWAVQKPQEYIIKVSVRIKQ